MFTLSLKGFAFASSPEPLRETSARGVHPDRVGASASTLAGPERYFLSVPSILALRYPTTLSARVRINIIPKPLALRCFHTLTHSFAPHKTLSPVVSNSSTLFAQNTRG